MKLNTSPENQSLLLRRKHHLLINRTAAEAFVSQLALQSGLHYMEQKGFFSFRTHYIVDFYFPRPLKVCLEIDGPIHAQQKWYDEQRDAFLVSRGLRVIRITNVEAFRLTVRDLVSLVAAESV